MINVALVVPSWKYFADPFKLQPSHELYFATVIDDHYKYNGVMADVIDIRIGRKNNGHIGIPEKDIYFYWITKTADYPEIVEIAKGIKKLHPGSKHVAGGTHIEVFTTLCQNDFDTIVIGPGEVSFIDVINDYMTDSLKKVYKTNWKSIDFNNYPHPNRNYIAREAVVNTELFKKYGGAPSTSVMFSRGCFYKCIYCSYRLPPFIQRRSIENIEKEINYLKSEYLIKAFNLRDEICLPIFQKEAYKFFDLLKKSDIIWRGQGRINITKENLKLAKESGCVELALGVESVSQQVLNIINKKQTVEQIRDCFKYCNEFDIKTKMCLILGLPGEPKNIIDVTKKFIEEVKPTYVNISCLSPMPGSEIYNNPEFFGIENLEKDWSKYFHLMFRFKDEESFGLPFSYKKNTRFGESFSKEEIANNAKELQHYLQERDMVY